MQPSRDSSIWRSLAVAFGDGVAFGVGVKLTQPPQPTQTPKLDLSPLAHRIKEIEQRLGALQQAPRAVTPAPSGASFDQKVLEAVVNALDARVNEHASQVERRLTDLEAKIVIELKSLDRQDQSLAAATQTRLEEIQNAIQQELTSIRGSVEAERAILQEQVSGMQRETTEAIVRLVEEEVAMRVPDQVAAQVAMQLAERLPALEQAMQAHVSETLSAQFRPLEQGLREEIRQAAGRASSLVASAAEASVEDKVAPLRTDLAELRQRVGEADKSVLDLILAIGVMCRQAADKIVAPEPVQSPIVEEPAPPAPESFEAAEPVDEIGAVTEAIVEESEMGGAEIPPPEFLPTRRRGIWRFPLVSCFVLTAGGLLLLHYL